MRWGMLCGMGIVVVLLAGFAALALLDWPAPSQPVARTLADVPPARP